MASIASCTPSRRLKRFGRGSGCSGGVMERAADAPDGECLRPRVTRGDGA